MVKSQNVGPFKKRYGAGKRDAAIKKNKKASENGKNKGNEEDENDQ